MQNICRGDKPNIFSAFIRPVAYSNQVSLIAGFCIYNLSLTAPLVFAEQLTIISQVYINIIIKLLYKNNKLLPILWIQNRNIWFKKM